MNLTRHAELQITGSNCSSNLETLIKISSWINHLHAVYILKIRPQVTLSSTLNCCAHVLSIKELSFCHKLEFSKIYIVATWWLTFDTSNSDYLIYQIWSLNYLRFQRNRDEEIRVCCMDSIPLARFNA